MSSAVNSDSAVDNDAVTSLPLGVHVVIVATDSGVAVPTEPVMVRASALSNAVLTCINRQLAPDPIILQHKLEHRSESFL